MSASFSFDDVEHFTVGTLGPRGERVFYLQGRAEGELVSLRLEKQQVAALAVGAHPVARLPQLQAPPRLQPGSASLQYSRSSPLSRSVDDFSSQLDRLSRAEHRGLRGVGNRGMSGVQQRGMSGVR